ncbi:MAG: hypothetical protein GY807_24380 [Gammaproteobacteria bacterium]|nr:hypothetical protein [Gammaproteobacteria bacterium]
MNQDLTLSVVTLYSPSGADGYVLPNIEYRFTDAWRGGLGANVFFGPSDTFFRKSARQFQCVPGTTL